MRIGVTIGTLFLLAVHAAFGQQGGESWQQKALYVAADIRMLSDAFT